MFRIKICGITRTSDALSAVEAGADAIGLNFYAGSKRYVTPENAQPIADVAGESASKVGVFVNSPANEVNDIAKLVGLDWVQLHGDEPPEFLRLIDPEIHILRVYRVGPEGFAPVEIDLTACQAAGRLPNAILIDSAVPGEYGGTGTKGAGLDKKKVSDTFFSLPVLLAGGLTPENVAEAIRESRPHGVDVASGVESTPGIKDSTKVNRFVSEALRAFTERSS